MLLCVLGREVCTHGVRRVVGYSYAIPFAGPVSACVALPRLHRVLRDIISLLFFSAGFEIILQSVTQVPQVWVQVPPC